MTDYEARGGERDRFSTLRRRFAEGAIGADDIDWLCDLVDAADELADVVEIYVKSGRIPDTPSRPAFAVSDYRQVRRA